MTMKAIREQSFFTDRKFKVPKVFNSRFLFMQKLGKKPAGQSALRLQNQQHSPASGNVLIYVVVVMLIFGVLGVIMVSLFTSSTASTVTRNDTRRAIYMAESGMRYAFSELRKADFNQDTIINKLNTINYQVTNAGSFTINVFSPWFESDGNQSISSSPPDLALKVPIGEVPDKYTIPTQPDSPNNIYAVNYEFMGLNPTAGGVAEITGYKIPSPTSLALTLKDDFYATSDERIAFAVKPTAGQDINADGVNIDLPLEAQGVFPKYGGAITLRRNDYFYEERKEEPEGAPTKVVLTNLSKAPRSEWLTTQTGANDWVILSPRNYLVVPTGTSDEVTYGGDYLFGKGIYDASLIRPVSAPPDITAQELASNLSEQETGTDFFQTDTIEGTLNIAGGTGQFGSAFFNTNLNIGGEQNYCEQGACKLALGVRVFFLLDFNQQGDGITFTLLNASGKDASDRPLNTESSAGGDFALSELMGYAGDSRTTGGGHLDSTEPRGLQPPKFAVEFDTRTNNRVGDPPPDYCADNSTVNTDSRNDPLTDNKDAVQYVFWGRTNFLNIPCRDDNPLYDDNRHDADGEEPKEEWNFGTGVDFSFWHPAIGPDGTIYMSALDSKLYALNEDGTVKWTFTLGVPPGGNNDYMPGVDPNTGTIYSDIAGNAIVAINPDGTEKWRLPIDADFNSTPVVGPDGTIFFGTESTPLAIIAANPDGTERWQFHTGDQVNNVPALSPDGSVVYAVSNDDNLYAVNVSSDPAIDGTLRWQFPIAAESGEVNSSPTVNPADGTIYVGSDDQKVYALNPTARLADPTGVGGINIAQGEWAYTTGGDVESSAAIDDGGTPGDKSDDTIYIGSDDHYLYALRANGTRKWRYQTNGEIVSSPVIDLDGTIYVGSDDGRVYAINPNGTLKWFFATGDQVQSSPALGKAGFIHIGSNDGKFYTLSQFADPRNFKDEDKSSGKLLTVEDLDSSVSVDNNTDWLNGAGAKGSWAVRMEVECLLRDENEECASNADGEFEYELRLWMRQCPDQNDFPCSNILGTFFQDTRIEYDYTAVEDLPMRQKFSLSGAEQDAFERFFFGFTGAAGQEALEATISKFQLSFIRPGDPVVSCDSTNWPTDPPLADCTPEL
jgi:outer membrane protein assembly factor BamB/type II secretory pathway pseudopilin PulG